MNIETLTIALMLDGVKAPTRLLCTDAGMDFYLPEQTGEISLGPGQRSGRIDTGVAVDVPVGWALLLVPRSGLGTRGANLANTIGVVDHGYREPIQATILNSGPDPIYIKPGDRFMQGLLVPVATPELVIVDTLEEGIRGSFGSTGQ